MMVGMRFQRTMLILICSGFALSSCTASRQYHAVIEQLMERYHEIGQFTGSVLVSHDDAVVFEAAFGYANREWDILNTVDTKYRLGSVTKQFTAALIMDLVEDRTINLDDVISDYLPDFRRDVGSKVTIHHLLTHSGGFSLPEMTMEEYWDFSQSRMTTDDLIENYCREDLKFQPGEKFSYSSAGYMVLGAIIEKITGKAYAQVLQERIFDPLGMNDTGIDDPDRVIPQRASGYQTNYGLGNARYKYMPNSYASGALYSTVGDMFKWNLALNSDRFLTAESKNLMFESQIECHRGYYGYGWFVQELTIAESSQPVVFHAGDVSGFSAIIVRALEAKDCVVLLSNQEGLHYYDIAFNLLKALNGAEPDSPKEYVADILREAVFSKGRDHAIEKFSEIRIDIVDQYNPDEDELIELGYDLLAVDRPEDAVEVLKINVELHPESANAYDSLAEAYMLNDDYVTAVQNYKKSLEFDPDNQNAARMIEKMEKEQNKKE